MTADQKIISILKRTGPQTGEALLERTGLDVFSLWQTCRNSPQIHCEIAGKRFLRLDRAVAGYARLSPSIRREFQTYTVVGLRSRRGEVEDDAGRLEREIRKISRAKFQLARESMISLLSALREGGFNLEKICFIIGGDVAHEMAHLVPRPEISTGKMVRGSDLDIVAVAADDLPEEHIAALDGAIHDRKYYLLVHPRYREEIDYLIKSRTRLLEQLESGTFEGMVAGKILWEGKFLCGSAPLFQTVKKLIAERGIDMKLKALEEKAGENRARAEGCLLDLKDGLLGSEFCNLFFTREERLEDIG